MLPDLDDQGWAVCRARASACSNSSTSTIAFHCLHVMPDKLWINAEFGNPVNIDRHWIASFVQWIIVNGIYLWNGNNLWYGLIRCRVFVWFRINHKFRCNHSSD
jgi:hypothetical protein